MSLSFINGFHTKLYNILIKSDELKEQVDKVYVSVTQDTKYPFILINMLNTENLSTIYNAMFELEFEICIFARNKNQTALTLIADIVDRLLLPDDCHFAQYIVGGIKLQNLRFERAQDLTTNKLIMTYKTLIIKEII